MFSSSVYTTALRKFKLNTPVVFTFHINWKVYETLGLEPFQHVKNQLKIRGINNFEFLPILTDKNSDMTNRLKQFKRGLEKIVDKNDQKVHIIGYSFAGIIPKTYISQLNGEDYIQSLLTISTPHTSCRYVDLLNGRAFDDKWYLREPAIRSAGVYLDWLRAEYNSKALSLLPAELSPEVKYHSVGGRRMPIKCSESLRVSCEDILDDPEQDFSNDGLIWVEEAKFGKHLVNFDADHFELIGMRPKFNASMMFDLYAQTVKSCDSDFIRKNSKIEKKSENKLDISGVEIRDISQNVNLKY